MSMPSRARKRAIPSLCSPPWNATPLSKHRADPSRGPRRADSRCISLQRLAPYPHDGPCGTDMKTISRESHSRCVLTTRPKLTAAPTSNSAALVWSHRQLRATDNQRPRWIMSTRRTDDDESSTFGQPRACERTENAHETPSSSTKEIAAQATKVRTCVQAARRYVRAGRPWHVWHVCVCLYVRRLTSRPPPRTRTSRATSPRSK
jgi:hypothetical protein